jgi:hypothetical protein
MEPTEFLQDESRGERFPIDQSLGNSRIFSRGIPMNSLNGVDDSAEIPLPVTTNPVNSGGATRMRKSRFLGILIYILQKRKTLLRGKVSVNQALWIQSMIANSSVDELHSASIFASSLHHSPRVRQSLQGEINRILRVDRTPPSYFLAEKRRIGVGYRDKGTLRPHHSTREETSVVFHLDDVEYLLPLDHNLNREDWLTAEEVLSQLSNRDNATRAMLQVQSMLNHEV